MFRLRPRIETIKQAFKQYCIVFLRLCPVRKTLVRASPFVCTNSTLEPQPPWDMIAFAMPTAILGESSRYWYSQRRRLQMPDCKSGRISILFDRSMMVHPIYNILNSQQSISKKNQNGWKVTIVSRLSKALHILPSLTAVSGNFHVQSILLESRYGRSKRGNIAPSNAVQLAKASDESPLHDLQLGQQVPIEDNIRPAYSCTCPDLAALPAQ